MLKLRKRFGQNFLKDQRIIEQIIAVIAPQEGQHLVEIGPGIGALTKKILPLIKKLDVIELDRDLIPYLKANCDHLGEMNIHQADALKFDFKSLTTKNEKLRVFGNLPYNISSPLLFHLISFADHIQDMYFMLQKEVAERLAAQVGDKAYGRLGIMVQYFCDVELMLTVPPTAFEPAPKVYSAFVRLVPHKKVPYLAKDFKKFEEVVKTAFMQRRKVLRNALKPMITEEALKKIDINPMLRPEQISLEEYVRIADAIIAMNG